jgi:GxxExxY protein
MVEDKIAVEIKALLMLEPVHLSQALNYLKAFNIKVGLLLNFGSKRLEYHRLHNRKLQ